MKAQFLTPPPVPSWESVQSSPFVEISEHRYLPLFTAKYGRFVQANNDWEPVSLACRGIVFDSLGQLISYPFTKFFNLTEIDPDNALPSHWDWDRVEILEKLDGSMVAAFLYRGDVQLNTNGSFHSEQAEAAYAYLPQGFQQAFEDYNLLTVMFEFLHGSSHIVVPYPRSQWGLRVIAARGIDGKMVDYDTLSRLAAEYELGITRKFDFKSPEDLNHWIENEHNDTVFEGVVLHYPPTGERVKIKTVLYCQLHARYTGVHPNQIWDHLPDPSCVSPGSIREVLRVYREGLAQYGSVDVETNAKRLVAAFDSMLSDIDELEAQAQRIRLEFDNPKDFNTSDKAKELKSAGISGKITMAMVNSKFRDRPWYAMVSTFVDLFRDGDYYQPYSD